MALAPGNEDAALDKIENPVDHLMLDFPPRRDARTENSGLYDPPAVKELDPGKARTKELPEPWAIRSSPP